MKQSRQNSIGRAIGCALIILLPSVPIAWQFWTLHSEERDLQSIIGPVDGLEDLNGETESSLQEVSQTLSNLHDRLLTQENRQSYEDNVIRLVRTSKCKVRQINMGEPFIRRWFEKDDPLSDTEPENLQPTNYQLERTTLNLSVSGSYSETLACLAKLYQDQNLKYLSKVSIRPYSQTGNVFYLDIEMFLFGFAQVPTNLYDL